MLKIEVIKFEAQDVITTSIPAPAECSCPHHSEENAAGCNHGGCKFTGEWHNCMTVN